MIHPHHCLAIMSGHNKLGVRLFTRNNYLTVQFASAIMKKVVPSLLVLPTTSTTSLRILASAVSELCAVAMSALLNNSPEEVTLRRACGRDLFIYLSRRVLDTRVLDTYIVYNKD